METSEIIPFVTAGLLLLAAFVFFIINFVIMYHRRQLQNLREQEGLKHQFQQELLRTQMEIQEQTFTTISQEIHDNVGQTLSLAKVQVNIIDQSETTDKQLLAEVKQNIGKAMSDLRDLAKSLNSDHIQLVSLRDLIAPELARIQRSRIVATSLNEEGAPQQMAHQKKLILFRIVQESLQNIIKHAAASVIDVQLAYAPEFVEITIADNGKGFDPATVSKTAGLGLQNITNRAALIGGKASIKSRSAEGTTVTLNVPYA